MELIINVLLLFGIEVLYINLATRFGIVDKPNERSMHSRLVLRGGGIIFTAAFLMFLAANSILEISTIGNYLAFGIGFFIISIISFLDDLKSVSYKIRLAVHAIAAFFLLYFFIGFAGFPIWIYPFLLFLLVGIINAYNFMDGINGITGVYSLVLLFSLLYVNKEIVTFADERFIIYPILASVVFLFFNFRKKAKIFLGDVGSVGIAFWIVALLGLLIIKTENFKWILFLSVYGVEVIFTIVERLFYKENILKAHNKHLYDLLAGKWNIDHRWISLIYTFIQIIINIFVLKFTESNFMLFVVILLFTSLMYVFFKLYFIKKERKKNHEN